VSFIERFLSVLSETGAKPLVTEVHGDTLRPTGAAELHGLMTKARAGLRERGVVPGDRVVLLAPNSVRWVAADVAILAEGAICVPMYARQAIDELVDMMKDCAPRLVLCATESLANAVREQWPEADRAAIVLFAELFSGASSIDAPAAARTPDDPVTIIYTSGTSGEPKGVILTLANVDHMLPVIQGAVDKMMAKRNPGGTGDDRVFHYLPFCFAGSRMVLWMCLFRANGIMVSTDLNDLATEFKAAKPNYFLNVPTLLERIKGGVEAKIRTRGKLVQRLYDKGKAAFDKVDAGNASVIDKAIYAISKRIVFDKIHDQIGAELECLICGSAPLGPDTQRWFDMVGIAVYQVYGLTETTAIVTMDTPGNAVGGRVGYVIDGCETKLGEQDELLVRGPNIFAGYWNRPEASAEALDADGWFLTGDQVEFDANQNLRIVGRVRNLLVPSSGHNVAPEPIEQKVIETIEGVDQAVIIGHGRAYLTAIVTGTVAEDALKTGIDRVNETLPHYRRIRQFHLASELFTPENGLLTANTKLKRGAIETHYRQAVEAMYA
jgi:long-chain acyl-CoA synthetase